MFRKKDRDKKVKKADIPEPTTAEELRGMARRLELIAKNLEVVQKRKETHGSLGSGY